MKKFLLFLTCCSLLSGCSILVPTTPMRFQYCSYIDDYWGEWKEHYDSFKGSPGNFVVFSSFSHPSEFKYRVTVTNYNDAQLYKKDWFVKFQGYIEYRDITYRTTIKEKSRDFVQTPPSSPISKDIIKRPAEIRILKKQNGYVYNIYFDGVGLGLTIPWQYAR